MTEDNTNKLRAPVVLAVTSWIIPICISLILGALIWLDSIGVHIASTCTLIVDIMFMFLIPLCCGISLTCLALSPHLQNIPVRRHAIVGLIVSILIILLIVGLIVFGQPATPFIWAM